MKKQTETPESQEVVAVEQTQMEKELINVWEKAVEADKNKNLGFLTKSLSERISSLSVEVKNLIQQGLGFEKEIAKKMNDMFTIFLAEVSGIEKDVKKALRTAVEQFKEYSEGAFGFKEARAMEYQSVGANPSVLDMNLPFSHLVELARLSDDGLKQLLQMFPEEKLQGHSYREMRELVRVYNENKRTRRKSSASLNVVKNDSAPVEKSAPAPSSDAKPENVVSMPVGANGTIEALDAFIRQFKAISGAYRVEDVSAKYAKDLEQIAKWCLAASTTHLDERKRA
ncbi:MAG: hypothetical protein JNM39_17935 [Bdellovibrionaceae bacterium]|nr:hypothetical protein [Pseudobdellovibrionaceae bacterium]